MQNYKHHGSRYNAFSHHVSTSNEYSQLIFLRRNKKICGYYLLTGAMNILCPYRIHPFIRHLYVKGYCGKIIVVEYFVVI